ncbi:MAG: response regulator [Campylobacterales bacterium]
MSKAKELKTVTGDLSVLYVEDDEAIRSHLAQTLKLFFREVYVAEDGKKGLELFLERMPDLVISDIQMPRMNGLEMARQIKSVSDRIPVLFTTAYSDERYFIDSIELGVDRYILKPIEQDRFLTTLFAVARTILDRRQAEEYAKRQVQSRINAASEKTLLDAINLYPNPTLIYSYEGRLFAMNDAFLQMADKPAIERLGEGAALSDLFERREGFLSDLALIDEEDKSRNRVMIKGRHGRKIYIVDSRQIAMGEEGRPRMVYTFTDVTRLEYERQKSQNLSTYLRDLLYLRKRERPASGTPSPTAAPAIAPVAPVLEISQEEREVLRRSHVHKTTAAEYVREIAGDVLEEMDELGEIEKELSEWISDYEERPSDELLARIGDRLGQYGRTVAKLFEFGDLAFALEQLARFLPTLQSDALNVRRLGLLLESVRLDLTSWRRMIFVTHEAQDIHYLDSSLFSSCLQIELDFGSKESAQGDENDLDLF